MKQVEAVYEVDQDDAADFRALSDDLYARRHPGWPARQGWVPGVLVWLSQVTGWNKYAITKYRRGHRKVPKHWWVFLKLLADRQDLRDRLAASLRRERAARRRHLRPLSAARVRPLYTPREGDMEAVREEEWRRQGLLRS